MKTFGTKNKRLSSSLSLHAVKTKLYRVIEKRWNARSLKKAVSFSIPCHRCFCDKNASACLLLLLFVIGKWREIFINDNAGEYICFFLRLVFFRDQKSWWNKQCWGAVQRLQNIERGCFTCVFDNERNLATQRRDKVKADVINRVIVSKANGKK